MSKCQNPWRDWRAEKCRQPGEEQGNRDPKNWPVHSTSFQDKIKEGHNGEMFLPHRLLE